MSFGKDFNNSDWISRDWIFCRVRGREGARMEVMRPYSRQDNEVVSMSFDSRRQFPFFFFLIIYLVALGLSCGRRTP